jgi:VIT1/CCC1 family predicted Fe2+/Mn2+ transporter
MGAPTPPGYYRHYRRHDGSGALVLGMILILVGAFFFVRPYLPAFNWSLAWPIVVIAIGLVLVLFALARTRSNQ